MTDWVLLNNIALILIFSGLFAFIFLTVRLETLGMLIGIGIIIVGFILLGYVMLNEPEPPRTERQIWLDQLDNTAKTSLNCTELKELQLELIENGANAEDWDKFRDDTILKMAKDRYEVLCR